MHACTSLHACVLSVAMRITVQAYLHEHVMYIEVCMKIRLASSEMLHEL